MTPIEYWTNLFPEFMAKASEWDKELLSSPEAFKHSVTTEQDLRQLLELLRDFDFKKKQGKIMESRIFRRFNGNLDKWYNDNMIKNGFAQAGATMLITIGVSRMDIDYYSLSNTIFIAMGIILALVGRFLWGINVTNRQLREKINKRFSFTELDDDNTDMDVAGRRIVRMLIFIPLCSIVAIVTGLLIAEINHTRAGFWASGVGALVVLIDLVVIFCLSREK